MRVEEVFRDFAAAADKAPTVNALETALAAAVREIGFDHYALVHYVNIYRAGSRTVFLHNYPPEWTATVHVRKYLLDDPIAEVCRRQSAPFLWSDIPALIELSPQQREILRDARRLGLVNGCTLPFHLTGEPVGSCSFAAAGDLPADALTAVTTIGRHAFNIAHGLVNRDPGALAVALQPKTRIRLTKRQRDCVLLAGRGLSDLEASQILGLGEPVVTHLIEEARRTLGAATRMELVVRALYRSDVTFDELIDVESELAGMAVAHRREAAVEEPVPMARLGALFFGTNPELN
jgi:LuxR family quorum-sensing system transcriptional regulator CciR